jgi:LmbE family N-acetylglucosaminyl deacetylase
MPHYLLTRLVGEQKIRGNNLDTLFTDWHPNKERCLFVAPHDDDLCLGSGLLLQKALEEGCDIEVLITTDGSMGFGSNTPQSLIEEVRRAETLESFRILGINKVQWLNFPDGSLSLWGGVRAANLGDPCCIQGYTGLQNAFTAHLRRYRPSRIFVPAGSDLHPDHKMVYQELLISLFHASGDIWPQLGPSLPRVPEIYEMAIYCDFVAAPTMRLQGPEIAFNKKLASIMAYQSQQQIAALVENVRHSGPVEFFRPADFNLYVPARYNHLFD